MPERRRPSYDFRPATMTWSEAAAFAFRRSESWLRDHIPADFPRPDPTYGVFATEAVERWVRIRFGLAGPTPSLEDARDTLRARLAHGQDPSALPSRPAT